MTNCLSANPGQLVTLAVHVVDSTGALHDGYQAPKLDFVLLPGDTFATGYPVFLVEVRTGIWKINLQLPTGITAVGSYLASISWPSPDTMIAQNELFIINVSLPFGNASVLSWLKDIMTIYRSRSQTVDQTNTVQLRALFRGPDGQPADLDAFPTFSVIQPSGNVTLLPTSNGVYRLDTGLYGRDYCIGINSPIGIWTDVWDGTLDGIPLQGVFNFVVVHTDLPATRSDGYIALGDDPGFHFSQDAIRNINIFLKALKARLNSSGKSKAKDKNGNVIYIDCDIYSVDMLVTFLCDALSQFNQFPYFSNYHFSDDQILFFMDIIVQGATLYALASKALIERGREFVITDNGLNFTPPTVSELLNTQWGTEITNYMEKLKAIKNNMRPSPMGLGLISIVSGRSPVVQAL